MPIKVIQWDLDAWEDYLYWQSQDKKNLKKINKLLKDISRNPFEGIGKPGVAVSIDLFSCNGAHARSVFLRDFYDLLIVLDCKVMHGIIKFITLRSHHL